MFKLQNLLEGAFPSEFLLLLMPSSLNTDDLKCDQDKWEELFALWVKWVQIIITFLNSQAPQQDQKCTSWRDVES